MEINQFRIPESIDDALEAVAEAMDKSKSSVIRDYVEEGLERDGFLDHINEEVKEELRRMREQDEETEEAEG